MMSALVSGVISTSENSQMGRNAILRQPLNRGQLLARSSFLNPELNRDSFHHPDQED